MKKFTALLIAVIILTCSLFGCKKEEETNTPDTVRNDVSVEDLSTKILNEVSIDLLSPAGESYITLNIDIDLSLCEGYAVYINPTGTADAIGIFKASTEENAEKLLTQSKDYVKLLKDTWMTEYLPEEKAKLEKAVCKKMGSYVIYAILDDAARNAAIESFEKALTAATDNN